MTYRCEKPVSFLKELKLTTFFVTKSFVKDIKRCENLKLIVAIFDKSNLF